MTTLKVLLATVAGVQGQMMPPMMPAHMSVSSITAMGPDGEMHTSLRKVVTQTSDDGSQRIAAVECKDGDCARSERHFFASPMFASMTPSGLFAKMPDMPRLHRMEMPRMHHVMHCMHRMHQHVMTRVHPVIIRIMPRQHMHFLAPRVVTDAQPEVLMAQEPEMPFGAVLAGSFVFTLALGTLFLGLAVLCRSCFGKASARERPLRELDEPLAPAEQAELGMAAPRGQAVWAAPTKAAPQAYLMDLYERAEHKNQQKAAQAVLRDVYAAALARVQ